LRFEIGRYKQQAIVIRKGQTGGANNGWMIGQRPYVRPVTHSPATACAQQQLPLWRDRRNRRMITHRRITTSGIYSRSIAALRRGELSQLMTTSQAVDGLRGSFDNAVCVE
jgi:hypothetical protein